MRPVLYTAWGVEVRSYGVAIAMVQWQLPFGVGLVFGVALAVAFAVLLGMPVLRLRGHYFAIATLGFMLVLRQVAANLPITGGGSGMNLPIASAFTPFYYWMLGAVVLGALGGALLPRSRAGYAIAAIRENQDAAQVLGIEPLPYKILAYASNALLFGAVGGIYAYWFTFIDPPTVFNIDFSIQAVVMTLLGGPGTALGPVAGAIILKILDTILTNISLFLHNVFFGALVCVLIIFAPRGLAEVLRRRGGIVRAIRTELEDSRV